jgi:hypothetical protein
MHQHVFELFTGNRHAKQKPLNVDAPLFRDICRCSSVCHPSGHDIQLMGLFNGNGGHAFMSVQAFSSAD